MTETISNLPLVLVIYFPFVRGLNWFSQSPQMRRRGSTIHLSSAEEEVETQQDKINPDSKKVTDHLANDRTFLAWVRTGVSMMGLGVVIAKLRYIIGTSYPESSGIMHAAQIGLWFSAVGVLTIIMSVFFFLQTQKEIRETRYQSRKLYVLILAGLTGSLGLAILWYLMQPMEPATTQAAPVQELSR